MYDDQKSSDMHDGAVQRGQRNIPCHNCSTAMPGADLIISACLVVTLVLFAYLPRQPSCTRYI